MQKHKDLAPQRSGLFSFKEKDVCGCAEKEAAEVEGSQKMKGLR